MKSEMVLNPHIEHLIVTWIKKFRNIIAAVIYFSLAHIYDGICYTVSNLVTYPEALLIMAAFLFSVSLALVYLHKLMRKRFSWDIVGLNKLIKLEEEKDIPKYRIFKRLLRWTMRKGHWWIHIIGSCLIGPPVVTVLLSKKGSWKSGFFYLSSGTLISVIVWVTVWSGVGKLTWNQFVRPVIQGLLN